MQVCIINDYLTAGLGQTNVPVERDPLFRDISYMDIVSGQVLPEKQEALSFRLG